MYPSHSRRNAPGFIVPQATAIGILALMAMGVVLLSIDRTSDDLAAAHKATTSQPSPPGGVQGILSEAPTPSQPPKVDQLSPNSGPIATAIKVSGLNFTPTENSIFIQGQIVVSGLASPDGISLFFVLPAGICGVGSACPIKILNENGISNAVPFYVMPAPPPEPTPTPLPPSPELVPPPPSPISLPPTPPQPISQPGDDGHVTVLAPNGGEVWYKDGALKEIRWSTSRVPSNWAAKIRLVRGPVELGSWLEIFPKTANDGSEFWSIPKTLIEARDYRMQVIICNPSDGRCYDDLSDTYFGIFTLPPEIIPTTLPDGKISQRYSVSIGAREGLPPLAWSLTDGTLPSGLILTTDAGAGTISGTPAATGTFTFTAKVTDANGFSDTEVFSIKIVDPCDTSALRPSGYITYDSCSEQEPAAIRRANGDVVAVFNSSGNNLAVSRGAVSRDQGATWTLPALAVQSWDDMALTEGPNGQLVLLAWAPGGESGLVTYTSIDGLAWANKRKVSPAEINNSVGDIIYASDGYYYASYHGFASAATPVSDTMITRSRDLAIWDSPVSATDGVEHSNDSSLLQTVDGKFWLAYYVFPTVTHNGGVVIKSSVDAKTWSRVAFIPGLGPNHGAVNLIEYQGRPVVFGRMGYSTYYSYRLDTGAWSQPAKILDSTPFGGEAVVLADGTVGIVYTYIANLATDPYGQRDIRFANVGKLSIPLASPTPTPPPPPPPPPPSPSPVPATFNPSTASLKASALTVTAGQPFTLTVTGTSDIGLAAVWWFGTSTGVTDANVVSSYPATPTSSAWFTASVTNPTKLDRAFGSPWFSAAQAVKEYTFSSTVTISQPGVYGLGANSRDVLYPVAGEPHQASEGAGIAVVSVTVVQAVSPPPPPPALAASVTVTYANGGETLMQQTKPTIKWNASNVAGNTVTINLLKGGAFYRTIASQAPQSTATGSFSYVWAIPSDIPQGSDYQIEIVHAGDPNVRDSSDANFYIAPMPDTLTIRGRFLDRFNGAPVAGAGILTWDGTTRYLWYTNSNGEFVVTATTSAITMTSPKSFASWPTCYISQGIGIWRQADNNLSVSFEPFDLMRKSTTYSVSGTEVNLGDIPFWPSVTLHLYSDIPVKFWVRYPEEGSAVGNSLFKTIQTLSNVIPLNYNVRAELIDQAGTTYYSPYTTLPIDYGCRPITLTYQGGQYSWSPITAALISPNGGEAWGQGSTPTVIWQTKGFPIDKPENVTLQLRDSVDPSRSVATIVSTSTDATSYAWPIPTTVPLGKYLMWLDIWSSYIDYRSRASDFSDLLFSITAP